MKYLLPLLLIAAPASAQSVTPNFTTGSMTQTTTATQTVTEVVAIERMGKAKGLIGRDADGSKRLIQPHDDLLFDLHTPYYGEGGEPGNEWSKFTRAMVKDIDNHIENYPNVPAKPKARLVERRKDTAADADKERLEEALHCAKR